MLKLCPLASDSLGVVVPASVFGRMNTPRSHPLHPLYSPNLDQYVSLTSKLGPCSRVTRHPYRSNGNPVPPLVRHVTVFRPSGDRSPKQQTREKTARVTSKKIET